MEAASGPRAAWKEREREREERLFANQSVLCVPNGCHLRQELWLAWVIFCPRTSFNVLACLIESKWTAKWLTLDFLTYLSSWVNVGNRVRSSLSAL